MNMNVNMKMKMKMKMKMNMNSCTKTMWDPFRGRRQRPQAWESADPTRGAAWGAIHQPGARPPVLEERALQGRESEGQGRGLKCTRGTFREKLGCHFCATVVDFRCWDLRGPLRLLRRLRDGPGVTFGVQDGSVLSLDMAPKGPNRLRKVLQRPRLRFKATW